MSVEGISKSSATEPARPPGELGANYVRGMERLLLAVQELSMARSMPDIQRVVRAAARELTDCDGATFVLLDDGMCHYADEDAISPLFKGSRFPLDTCIGGWAMLNRDAAVIPDVYGDERIPHAAYRSTFIKSLVMVPIRKLDPVGAIGNYWAHERRPTEQEVSLLQALADATSVAMENVRLSAELEQRVHDRTAELERANEEIRHLSITDDLTGVNNRRGFYLLAAQGLHAARRDGRACLLAFIDVDALKRVNDDQGHLVGDALLIDVARVLRGMVGPSDVLARVGGDEFCVLVTDHDAEPAVLRSQLMDALRHFTDAEPRSYRLSISIGLLQVPATDASSVDELLARADERMYEQKKGKT